MPVQIPRSDMYTSLLVFVRVLALSESRPNQQDWFTEGSQAETADWRLSASHRRLRDLGRVRVRCWGLEGVERVTGSFDSPILSSLSENYSKYNQISVCLLLVHPTHPILFLRLVFICSLVLFLSLILSNPPSLPPGLCIKLSSFCCPPNLTDGGDQ